MRAGPSCQGPQLQVAGPGSAGPSVWPSVAQVGRARGARGSLTLRLARTPERWIERNNGQRKSYLSTGGFQLTGQISGWDPEREQTVQNGKCKLLDDRRQVSMLRVAQGRPQLPGPSTSSCRARLGRARLGRPKLLPRPGGAGLPQPGATGRKARVPSCDHDGRVTGSARSRLAAALAAGFGSPPCLNFKWTLRVQLAPVPVA